MPSKSKKPDPKPPKQNPTPNWPPLRPLLPAADLTLTPLLTDQVYLIRNLLPASLCKTYVSFLASLPLTTTPGKPKRDEALRVNDRFQIDDGRFAEMLWSTTALKELVTTRFENEYDTEEDDKPSNNNPSTVAERAQQLWGGNPLGLNPNIRIYRYSAGQFFGQHCTHSLEAHKITYVVYAHKQRKHYPIQSTANTLKRRRRSQQRNPAPAELALESNARTYNVDSFSLPEFLHGRRNDILPGCDAGESQSGADSCCAGGWDGTFASAWRSVYDT